MTEAEVVRKTHQFLKNETIHLQSVMRLYTDAHATLLADKSLQPFQRFFLDLGDMVLHPDLVGQLSDGECVFAVEAKGTGDMLKGLTQAEFYQTGFHLSFLAAHSSAWTETLVGFARRKNLGVISVGEDVVFPFVPEPGMPWREPFQRVFRQLETAIQVSGRQTYLFNLPTHYLVWAIVQDEGISYPLVELSKRLAVYPMPEDWRSALAGAQKLGIVSIQGSAVKLTYVGRAVKAVLPTSVIEWAQIHDELRSKGRSITLCQRHPQSASMLRVLLLQDPLIRLIVDGLEMFPNRESNFAELASTCDRLDHSRAPVFFLKPASQVKLGDDRGRIRWEQAVGEDYRSTTFMQYKSILKHSGLLRPTQLGGSTSKRYDPIKDIWALN
jgi:hypothetical protein